LPLLGESADHEAVVLLNRLPHTLPGKELRSLFASARELCAQLWIINQATDGGGECVRVSWLDQDPVTLATHHAAVAVNV